jgi:phospholipid/cholesterol/gamma-HCH transport system substrate-binding protein
MNNRNLIVGIFVSIAMAAFISATLWLTGRQGTEPTVNYSIFFEKDVSGLMLGGSVFYLGVSVGTVTSMDIIPGNPMRVRVNAEVLKSAPINAGTYASLAYQGITGVAVVKLNAEPGEHGSSQTDPVSGFPVIPVRDIGLSAVLSKAPEIVEKLDKVLVQVNQILGEDNRAFISNMLEDVATFTGALAANEQTITEIPVLLKQTIEELHGGLQQIRAMVDDLQPGLQTTLANLEKTTGNLAEMTDRLEAWTANNDGEMNAFMGDGLGQVPALVSEARATLREIKKLVKDLRENPSMLIYKPNEGGVDPEQ